MHQKFKLCSFFLFIPIVSLIAQNTSWEIEVDNQIFGNGTNQNFINVFVFGGELSAKTIDDNSNLLGTKNKLFASSTIRGKLRIDSAQSISLDYQFLSHSVYSKNAFDLLFKGNQSSKKQVNVGDFVLNRWRYFGLNYHKSWHEKNKNITISFGPQFVLGHNHARGNISYQTNDQSYATFVDGDGQARLQNNSQGLLGLGLATGISYEKKLVNKQSIGFTLKDFGFFSTIKNIRNLSFNGSGSFEGQKIKWKNGRLVSLVNGIDSISESLNWSDDRKRYTGMLPFSLSFHFNKQLDMQKLKSWDLLAQSNPLVNFIYLENILKFKHLQTGLGFSNALSPYTIFGIQKGQISCRINGLESGLIKSMPSNLGFAIAWIN